MLEQNKNKIELTVLLLACSCLGCRRRPACCTATLTQQLLGYLPAARWPPRTGPLARPPACPAWAASVGPLALAARARHVRSWPGERAPAARRRAPSAAGAAACCACRPPLAAPCVRPLRAAAASSALCEAPCLLLKREQYVTSGLRVAIPLAR